MLKVGVVDSDACDISSLLSVLEILRTPLSHFPKLLVAFLKALVCTNIVARWFSYDFFSQSVQKIPVADLCNWSTFYSHPTSKNSQRKNNSQQNSAPKNSSQEKARNLDVLVIPGGKTFALETRIGNEGKKNIKKFVEEFGGGFVGIYAGTFFIRYRNFLSD